MFQLLISVAVKAERINESSFWFVGERAGDGYLQLQLSGCRPGQDLWSLLVPGRQSVSPVTVAGQIHHPLQQGHAPPAATQQHAIQGLSVCKIFIILWYQPYEICSRCVSTVGSWHTNKNDRICFPFSPRVPLRPCVQLAGLRTSSPSSASWRMPRASFTSLSWTICPRWSSHTLNGRENRLY